jgi:hypothetical protein
MPLLDQRDGQSYVCSSFKNGLKLQPTTVTGQPKTNLGLFTDRPFLNGEIISEYVGTILTRDEATELRNQHEDLVSHVISLDSRTCINGKNTTLAAGVNLAQYINDGNGHICWFFFFLW